MEMEKVWEREEEKKNMKIKHSPPAFPGGIKAKAQEDFK